MRVSLLVLIPAVARALAAQHTPTAGDRLSTIPLVGSWRLNLARTHYGAGVDARQRETLTCDVRGGLLHCAIQSIRHDGRSLTGRFAARLDGTRAPVSGIPDVDTVELRQPAASLLDATFFWRGQPVFGYRAYASDDAQSLIIVTVDPISRAVLTSVVVYDRR